MGSWQGTWRNQYGSVVEILSDDDGRVEGRFTTALESSAMFGEVVPLTGGCSGRVIAVSGASRNVRSAVSYTGMLVEDRMETLWHFVVERGDDSPWWSSALTNHDTFERVAVEQRRA